MSHLWRGHKKSNQLIQIHVWLYSFQNGLNWQRDNVFSSRGQRSSAVSTHPVTCAVMWSALPDVSSSQSRPTSCQWRVNAHRVIKLCPGGLLSAVKMAALETWRRPCHHHTVWDIQPNVLCEVILLLNCKMASTVCSQVGQAAKTTPQW